MSQVKVQSVGKYSKGCHKCGGYPGGKINSAQLLQCPECGFFTCNKHLKGGIGKSCPNCGCHIKKMIVALDQNMLKKGKGKGGGLPSSVKGSGGKIDKNKVTEIEEGEKNSPSASFGGGGGSKSAPSPISPQQDETDEGQNTSSKELASADLSEHDSVREALEESRNIQRDSLEQEVYKMSSDAEAMFVKSPEHQLFTQIGDVDDDDDDDFLLIDKETVDKSDSDVESSDEDIDETVKTLENISSLVEEGVDLEAIAYMEELLESQKEGAKALKTVYTDAFFKPGSLEGFNATKGYLSKQENSLSIISTDVSRVDLTLAIAKFVRGNKHIFGIAGFGAQSIKDEEAINVDVLRPYLKNNKQFIGIGECGLDYHYGKYTQKEQLKLLEQQIDLAEELSKPIFVNSVDADQDLTRIIARRMNKNKKLQVVFVPVIRSVEMLQLCLEQEIFLIIRPEITYDEEELYRECIKEMPLNRLLIASGAEWSAPKSRRGRWNSPEYLKETVKKSCEILQMNEKEFLQIMAQNFNQLFNNDPNANDDFFEFRPTDNSPTLVISTKQLLENDIDEDGDQLTVVNVDGTSQKGGNIYFDKKNQRIVYMPKKDFDGVDKFLYTIADGRGGTDTAMVYVTVLPKELHEKTENDK